MRHLRQGLFTACCCLYWASRQELQGPLLPAPPQVGALREITERLQRYCYHFQLYVGLRNLNSGPQVFSEPSLQPLILVLSGFWNCHVDCLETPVKGCTYWCQYRYSEGHNTISHASKKPVFFPAKQARFYNTQKARLSIGDQMVFLIEDLFSIPFIMHIWKGEIAKQHKSIKLITTWISALRY